MKRQLRARKINKIIVDGPGIFAYPVNTTTMDVFPVSSSILAAEHIANFVKKKYMQGESVAARILKTGISHTYLISAGTQQWIFRVYSLNWRTEKEIEEEIRLLQLLKENDIPVSYAIADKASAYIQRLYAPEGLRYGVLFTFAKGGKMLNFPADLHYKLGEIMARLHAVTRNLSLERVSYTPKTLLTDSFEQLKKFLPEDTDEMQYMKLLQKYLNDAFVNANADKFRRGIVHLDIWFDNISIDNTDICIFDFDFCGNGWLALDIAYYILQVYSTEKEGNGFNIKKDSFLAGYESITAISKEEKDLIPAAAISLYFFYLGVQCSRYNDWSNTFLNEIYLKRFINLLIKKWANFQQINIDPPIGVS